MAKKYKKKSKGVWVMKHTKTVLKKKVYQPIAYYGEEAAKETKKVVNGLAKGLGLK